MDSDFRGKGRLYFYALFESATMPASHDKPTRCTAACLRSLWFATLLVAWPAAAIEVVVEGLPLALRKPVLEQLSIEQQKNESDQSPAAIRALHARAAEEIRAALLPRGYYRAQVTAELTRGEQGYVARYRVELGEALRIGELDLQVTGDGLADPDIAALLKNFPLRQGEVLDHERYEAAKAQLTRLGADRGYLDAKLTRNTVQVDLVAYTASVVLHYQTGARYRFGAVQFEPGSGLDPELLARYVPFAVGEPFDAEQLIELRRGLVNSDYFRQIEISPRRDRAVDGEVPIVVKLVPRPPNKYTLGLGYGTDTGVRGKAGWERRLLNEDGHRLATEVNASKVRDDLTASYIIPVRDPRTDQLSFNVGVIDEHPDTSDSRRYTAGVALTHAGGLWSLAEGRIAGWRSTYGLNYEHETWETGNESGQTTLLMPNASWLYLVTDNRLVSTRGWRAQLDMRGSSAAISSDVTFGQARAQAKIIQPLGTRGRMVARLDVGSTWIEDFSTLPSSLRFYAGGDQSVRGYAYNSLGPKDEGGNVIGGPRLLVGSIEYEHRILAKWSLATFFDSGNAVESFDGPYYNGAGVGVHWRSPIGLIRLDVAWPLTLEDRAWRVHFVIGPEL
jgi:translocation and assembly module TamA